MTLNDEPRKGKIVELQLGLPQGAKIIRQRMLRLGNGPGLELFQIEASEQRNPLKLSDYGINHMSVYCDDINACVALVFAQQGGRC